MKTKKWIWWFVGAIVILLSAFVVLGIWIPSVVDNLDEEDTILVESTLVKAVDISELSTANFTYDGIAEYYKNEKDEKKGKVKCYIHYRAVVKASADMSEIEFEIDQEKKTVKAKFPEIEVNSNSIDLEESTLSFIPDNTTIELKDAIKTCQEDISREAKSSEELFEVARNNLENTVEALLLPIVEGAGYTFVK